MTGHHLGHHLTPHTITSLAVEPQYGTVVIATIYPNIVRIYELPDWTVLQSYTCPISSPITATHFGPEEVNAVLITGHEDGHLVLFMLPNAEDRGSISFLRSMTSKLKLVKGTVHQAQHLAKQTIGNAKAVKSTATVIANEAIIEAKSFMTRVMDFVAPPATP